MTLYPNICFYIYIYSLIRPTTKLQCIDHVVGNLEIGTTDNIASWYRSVFKFSNIFYGTTSTGKTGLKTIAVGNGKEVRIPLLEPLKTDNIGQNQEFLYYNNGPGIQHIAFSTHNIIQSVHNLKERGVKFQAVPKEYYSLLEEKIRRANDLKFDLPPVEYLKRQGILLDFDSEGYLLQTFAQVIFDRPTLFIEIIERHNHNASFVFFC